MTRTRRKQYFDDGDDDEVENTLDVTEKSNIKKTPETEAYESIYQRKKILWRPNRGSAVQKTKDRSSKTTFQDYLDGSESSEDLENTSDHSDWSEQNTSSARKMKTVGKTSVKKAMNLQNDSDEEIPIRDNKTLVYSPLSVMPGKADGILDMLHESHVRGLERSQALLEEEEVEFLELVPSKEVTENPRQSPIRNPSGQKMTTRSHYDVRGADIFRKPSMSLNQKSATNDKTFTSSPVKGTVKKEAKKKPSLNVPGSFSASFVSRNQEQANSTLKSQTSHTVSRFEKHFSQLDRLAFLNTPHQMREPRSPEKLPEDINSPANQPTMHEAKVNKQVDTLRPVKTKVSISFLKPGAPETITSYPSPIREEVSDERTNLPQPSTTAEQSTSELSADSPVSIEFRKTSPEKRRETEVSVEHELAAANQETPTTDSPNKLRKIDMEGNTASVNVSITPSPLKSVDGSIGLVENRENSSPGKSHVIESFVPSRTRPVLDQASKDYRNTHDSSQSSQAPCEVEPSLDEETTAGLMFEKEMRERKMKQHTPHFVPHVQSQLMTDAREMSVYKQSQLNYCTTDYDPAVPEDPIQVCNIANTPLLRVNSWKLLPGMAKPVTRLGSSLCYVTVLGGRIELQVTQKNGKIVKTYLSAQDVAYIPEDSIYEIKNVGVVTSVILVYHLQGHGLPS